MSGLHLHSPIFLLGGHMDSFILILLLKSICCVICSSLRSRQVRSLRLSYMNFEHKQTPSTCSHACQWLSVCPPTCSHTCPWLFVSVHRLVFCGSCRPRRESKASLALCRLYTTHCVRCHHASLRSNFRFNA